MSAPIMHRIQVIIVSLCCICWNIASCIQNNHREPFDITNDPAFNCRWYGGSIWSRLQCDCVSSTEEYVIRAGSIPPFDVSNINITNCGKLIIAKDAIRDMRNLRLFALENISSIELQEESLVWLGFTHIGMYNLNDCDPAIPSIKLRIAKSGIDEIANNAIKGRINAIEFIENDIQYIAPFGVSNLQQNCEIYIDRTRFHNINPQSFKKFTTNTLIIKNSIFETIPSRAFYEIVVRDEFRLDNITILDTLKPAGFIVNEPTKFTLANSRINHLSSDSFKVSTSGDVFIKDNYFNTTGVGAFLALARDNNNYNGDTRGVQTITFERNVFRELSKDALVVDKDAFQAVYQNLQITEQCNCGKLERYFRNGENTLELSCLGSNEEWVTVDQFKKESCKIINSQSGIAYIIGGVCAIILVLVIGFLIFYFRHMERSKSYGNNNDDKNGKLSMIVPDGRTYRETELHVIVERTDLLTTDL